MNGGNHEVRTPFGFLGLRIPTKANVLALIKVAPALEPQLTKLAAALPEGNYVDLDDDPQWVLDRALILQAAGILDENFQPTERFVEIVVQGEAARGPEQFNAERKRMKRICSNCHSKSYINDFFKNSDDVLKNVDRVFAEGVSVVQKLVRDGIIPQRKGWKYLPDLLQYYDAKTAVEQELFMIVLEYKQRAFQGSYHASNDYAHWYGWAPLNKAVNEIKEKAAEMRAAHKKG